MPLKEKKRFRRKIVPKASKVVEPKAAEEVQPQLIEAEEG